jgi:hypothetical protein
MKKRIFMGLAGLAMMAAAAIVTVSSVNANTSDSDLLTKNLEALTRSEGGTECFGGCKQIGWGWDQIFRCDCTYTGVFSSCDSWGC